MNYKYFLYWFYFQPIKAWRPINNWKMEVWPNNSTCWKSWNSDDGSWWKGVMGTRIEMAQIIGWTYWWLGCPGPVIRTKICYQEISCGHIKGWCDGFRLWRISCNQDDDKLQRRRRHHLLCPSQISSNRLDYSWYVLVLILSHHTTLTF